MNPPPITTADLGLLATAAAILVTSSTVRSVCARSIPSIGGIIGWAPGLKTKVSYSSS